MEREQRKALLLSVGYGQGHHAAAAALSEELALRGWVTRTADPCAEAYPILFPLTQKFYHFCVRRAPWVWGITYAQTDTANWRRQVEGVALRRSTEYLRELIREYKPDVILCTYPLFAYMLDLFADEGWLKIPYAVVVTDAIEISRPWMLTKAPLVCVPDEVSAREATDRYALASGRLAATGFPVRRAFAQQPSKRGEPSVHHVRVTYGVYCCMRRACSEIRALLRAFPGMFIHVLGGERHEQLARALAPDMRSGRIRIYPPSNRMAQLFADSHIYIGKAGAATMFEAYAATLPLIINYSLPGQEQGNLALLLHDGCGFHAEGAAEIVPAVARMLDNRARIWRDMRQAMVRSERTQGAVRIIDLIESRFFS